MCWLTKKIKLVDLFFFKLSNLIKVLKGLMSNKAVIFVLFNLNKELFGTTFRWAAYEYSLQC